MGADADSVTVQDVYDYLTKHADKFNDPLIHCVAWVRCDGKVVLDLSIVQRDLDEAKSLGLKHD